MELIKLHLGKPTFDLCERAKCRPLSHLPFFSKDLKKAVTAQHQAIYISTNWIHILLLKVPLTGLFSVLPSSHSAGFLLGKSPANMGSPPTDTQTKYSSLWPDSPSLSALPSSSLPLYSLSTFGLTLFKITQGFFLF